MYLCAFLVASPLELLSWSLYIWNHHVNVAIFVVVVVVHIVVVIVDVVIVCCGGFTVVVIPVLEVLLKFVECPGRKVAALSCLPNVFHFFI